MHKSFVMNYPYTIFLTVLSVLTLGFGCAQSQQKNETLDSIYSYKTGDRNGIGKWYKGREIARVMGYQGIDWLERPERETEEHTAQLLENLGVQADDTIADIGAGSGYHALKLSPMAPKGLIYAVDIQDEMLAALDSKRADLPDQNIQLVKGSETSANLPEASVDKILMVDVYHEFAYPYEMLQSIKKALRPDGKIYLIEYRAEDDSVPMKRLHKMSETQAVKEFKALGFKLHKNITNLPWQHCMVFILPQP